MDEPQSLNFFTEVNKEGKNPIDSLINKSEIDMEERWDHDLREWVFDAGTSIENELKALKVMVSHLSASHEKQV